MHRNQVLLVLRKDYLRIECDPALKRGPIGKLSSRRFGRWEEAGIPGEDVDRKLPAVLTTPLHIEDGGPEIQSPGEGPDQLRVGYREPHAQFQAPCLQELVVTI